ncbi:MAG TPA: hypothetical protein VIJ85_13900 [Rhizomicrobium sp.]
MREEHGSAGDAPAHSSAAGGELRDVVADDLVPANQRLRAGLGECQALIADCAAMMRDADQPPGLRTAAAATAAKLAAASAQTAGAIARLADAETRQRLASAKLNAGFVPRRRPRTMVRSGPTLDSYNSKDWEDKSPCEEPRFNSET